MPRQILDIVEMSSSRSKIGFYIDSSKIGSRDLRHPERGNPGVGGSQFVSLNIVRYLLAYAGRYVEPIIITQNPEIFPHYMKCIYVDGGLSEVLETANREQLHYVVCRPSIKKCGIEDFFSRAEKLGVRLVFRAAITPSPRILTAMYESPAAERLVCVGRKQYEDIRDHPIMDKTVQIDDIFDPSPYMPEANISKDGSLVVFVGSLIPAKSFHVLAEAWPEVIRKRPDARLVVVGSGSLYADDSPFGPWGVADEAYERRLRRSLADRDGQPHSSVTFSGCLGAEKIPLLQKARVIVANPTGRTETACAVAKEAAASGTPLIAAKEAAFLDLVQDGKTGILIRGRKQLAKSILTLLNDDELAERMGSNALEYARERYNPGENAIEWANLFDDIDKGKNPEVLPVLEYSSYLVIWIKDILRYFKILVPGARNIPLIREWIAKCKRITLYIKDKLIL
ncbi:MAG: glycosyltransferase family 4 protein [Gammaproteobacteria bacterium]|nr:glycosyltransferase family 4 protein [Gammaproteobacteria bacterium]